MLAGSYGVASISPDRRLERRTGRSFGQPRQWQASDLIFERRFADLRYLPIRDHSFRVRRHEPGEAVMQSRAAPGRTRRNR